MNLENYLAEHIELFNKSKNVLQDIENIACRICECLINNRKVLIAGNGGSAADAQHFAAEFTGRFEMERSGLNAIALTTDTSALTAIANDYGYHKVFSRQLAAIGNKGDVFIGISTSGKSESIINALNVAREKGITSIMMTGKTGEPNGADFVIRAQSEKTSLIQEFHSFALHCICKIVDEKFAK